MKRFLPLLLLVSLACLTNSMAEVITDDFNRDAIITDQTSSSDPNAIGSQYTIVNGSWRITSAGLLVATVSSGIMYENTLQTLRSDGYNFTLQMDTTVSSGTSFNRWTGLVFGYQDANNYYVLRYAVNTTATAGAQGTLQLVRVLAGATTALGGSVTLNLSSTASTYYRLSVSSDGNDLTYTIASLDGASIYNSESSYSNTITDLNFLDGYSGFYRNGSGSVYFDNYSLTVVPEPSTFLLLGVALVGVAGYKWRRRPVLS